MEFIYTDKNFIELNYLRNASLDIEIGKYGVSNNDFEVTLNTKDKDPLFNKGSLFYCVDSEWGGIVDNVKVNTANNTISLKGKTFRGMLEKEYIQPPAGEDYLVLNDNAQTCINTMLEGRFSGLFVADSTSVSINYNVRDLNLLEALEKSLAKSNAKLEIKFSNDKVHLIATAIEDLSDLIQYDNSLKVYMTVETAPKQYNHILALGSGELAERLRLNIFKQKDGTWGDTKYFNGLDKLTYLYDNSNAETLEELRADAIESVESLITTDTLAITLEGDDVNLFDIVGAKEEITGISFKQPVTQKILKGNTKKVAISYKVGE